MREVFKALSHPGRRRLLDKLFGRDGQTLGQLEVHLDMTRFGVMKHLRVLERAGLVTTRRVGREKFHYLNPVPIRRMHDRWIRKYQEHVVATLNQLKHELETPMTPPLHVHEIYIRTSPERLWRALTDPGETEQYFYRGRVRSTWEAGARIEYWLPGDKLAIAGELLEVVPHRKFRHTWHAMWDEKIAADRPTVVCWEITPMGSGCKLSVTYEDLAGRNETYRQVSGGLPYILSGLKTLLETGTPLILEMPA